MTEEKQPMSALGTVLLPSSLTGDCSRGSALSQETNNVLKNKSETAPGGLDHSKFYH